MTGKFARSFLFVCWGCHSESHRTGGFNSSNVLSHCAGGQKSEMKVWAGLLSSEASLLADGCPLPVSSRGRPSLHVCVLISSSCKDTRHTGEGPSQRTSFYLNYLFKDLTPSKVTF